MYFLLNIGIFQCHVSFQGCIASKNPTPANPAKVGLLVGTLAQTKAGPEIQEANNDRLKPLAYGARGMG